MCLKKTNANHLNKVNLPGYLLLFLLITLFLNGIVFSQQGNKEKTQKEQDPKSQKEKKEKTKQEQNPKAQKDQPDEDNREQKKDDDQEEKKGNPPDYSINPIKNLDTSYTKSYPKGKIKFSPGYKYRVEWYDNRLIITEEYSGRTLVDKKFKFKINDVAVDKKTGDRIYVNGSDGCIYFSDINKDDYSIFSKGKNKPKGTMVLGPGGDIAIATKDSLIFRNAKTGGISNNFKSPPHEILLDFLSEHRIITVGKDNMIRIWDKDTGREIMNRQIHPSHIQAATLSLDKRYLVIGTYDFKITISAFQSQARSTDLKERFKLKIIDTSNLSIIKEIDGTTAQIREISLSADNKFASVLKDDNTIDVWGLENGHIIQSFTGEPYRGAEFTDDGRYFYLITNTGQIQRWITQGIVVESPGPQYVGEKYKINTSKTPIITKSKSGITLAILDFSGLLIDSQVAEAISYSFRNKISNYSYINVVERDEMGKILKEQGLQNSGVTSPEAAAQIGKVLNADKLIMGKLSRLGSTLITTIKVVDVESARIEGGREVECQNYALENVPEIIDILLSILIE